MDLQGILGEVLDQVGFGSNEEAAATIIKNVDLARRKDDPNETKQTPPVVPPTQYTQQVQAAQVQKDWQKYVLYGAGFLIVVAALGVLLPKGK